MRLIFLSPHLDDAILSAGGWLYEQAQAGWTVEVWTLMCGFPPDERLSDFARELHAKWGFSSARETVQQRRQEDLAATGRVGALPLHFDFLDCIYRRASTGEVLYPNDVFVPPHPLDENLPAQIADQIRMRLYPDDEVICPLGIGSHVDHVLVRRAAERLSRPLLYVADLPYLFEHPAALAGYTAGMQKKLHRITESGLRSWLEAIEAYSSQVSSLFQSREQMQRSYHQYLSEQGGFSVWQVAAGG